MSAFSKKEIVADKHDCANHSGPRHRAGGGGGGDCGQRNCNAYAPSSVGGYTLLACSYFPCGFALVLIFAHIFGYYRLFLFGLLAEHAGARAANSLYALGMTTGTFCIAMTVISYFRTVVTAPGYVPAEPWARQPLVITDRQTPPADHDHFVSTVTHKRELRYCRRCAVFKPDDAHHCSQCQRCVLRMDHHCPWVNNCVGRDNTKYFILFLSWLGFTCLYFFIQIMIAYGTLPVKFSLASAGSHLGLFMLTIGLGIFGVFMSCFGGFHLQMLFSGQSTLGEVMDHQPKSAQFREVFGSPSSTWYHFLPLAPVNRRSRHRPNPNYHLGGGGATAAKGTSSSPTPSLPLPSVGAMNEDAINHGNSTYFQQTPRPPASKPPPHPHSSNGTASITIPTHIHSGAAAAEGDEVMMHTVVDMSASSAAADRQPLTAGGRNVATEPTPASYYIANASSSGVGVGGGDVGSARNGSGDAAVIVNGNSTATSRRTGSANYYR